MPMSQRESVHAHSSVVFVLELRFIMASKSDYYFVLCNLFG